LDRAPAQLQKHPIKVRPKRGPHQRVGRDTLVQKKWGKRPYCLLVEKTKVKRNIRNGGTIGSKRRRQRSMITTGLLGGRSAMGTNRKRKGESKSGHADLFSSMKRGVGTRGRSAKNTLLGVVETKWIPTGGGKIQMWSPGSHRRKPLR